MKNLALGFFFLSIFFVSEVGLKINKNSVSLAIDKNTTGKELNQYKAALLKYKINLQVSEIQRDKNNKIGYIKIEVNCNDGFKGSVSEDLMKTGNRIGFYRIYNTKGSPFGMNPL